MRYINLSQGKRAKVDDESFHWLNQWKWCLSSKGYAVRSVCLKDLNGRITTKTILMHRLILGTLGGKDTDHVNGNKLDNQIANLRIVSRSENAFNQGAHKDSWSGIKGVRWDTANRSWRSQIQVDGKFVHLGYFKDVNDAIDARNTAAVKYHGSFARLNTHL